MILLAVASEIVIGAVYPLSGNLAKVGTDVYIFDSQQPKTAVSGSGGEHHSDLDFRSH